MRKKTGKRILTLMLAVTLVLGATGCGQKGQDSTSAAISASDAANGVARVCSIFIDSLLGTRTAQTGSCFGVGVAGEATDIFVTNRHVVAEENASGGYTVADRVYIMLDANSLSIDYYYAAYNGTAYPMDGDTTLEIDGTSYLLEDETECDINDSRMIECDVIDYSEEYDIAILRAVEKVEDRIALEIADTAEIMNVADTVYAMGYPGYTNKVTDVTELEYTGKNLTFDNNISLPIYTNTITFTARIEDQTITKGAVSRFTSMTKENSTKAIQHDATINSGNSGGPLVNSGGVVVGVNTWNTSATESGNYAIYIDLAKDLLDENDIAYDVAGEKSDDDGFKLTTPMKIGIVAAAVVIIAIIVIVLILVFRKKKPTPAQNIGPAPVQQPQQPTTPAQPVPQPAAAAGQNDSGFRIQGVSGAFANRRFSIMGVVKLGRDPQANQITFPEGTKGISRIHCEVYVTDGQVYIRDLGSAYGTYIGDGQKLMANQPTALMPGDKFYLGSANECFVIDRKA